MTDPTAANAPGWAKESLGAGAAATFDLETHPGSITGPVFTRELLTRGLRFNRAADWPTEATSLLPTVDPVLHMASHGNEEALLEDSGKHGYAARVLLGDGRLFAQVAATTADVAEEVLADLLVRFPRAVPDPEAPRVAVTFWSLGEMGPSGRTRMIDVPPWDAIADNYPEMARRGVGPLMSEDFAPGSGGQLVLWHGPPGTGKTYALRALAWEWREWCDLHYVADPERFFGDKAAYMMDVLLSGDDTPVDVGKGEDKPEVHKLAKDGRWRLLVLEDSGELMSADARTRSGQGLGRLLNVVDGLIGQGLRILVLVTTNEPLPKLHEAISRPGRCAANVQFPAMPRTEAQDWLDAQGYDGDPLEERSTYTAAELFAIRDGANEFELAEAGVGFS